MKKILITSVIGCFFLLLLMMIAYFYHTNNKTAQAVENESTEQTYLELDSEKCGEAENEEKEAEDVCEKSASHVTAPASKIVNILKDDSISKHLK